MDMNFLVPPEIFQISSAFAGTTNYDLINDLLASDPTGRSLVNPANLYKGAFNRL